MKMPSSGLPTNFRVFCGAQVPFETPNWRIFVEHAHSRPVRRLDASAYETDQRTRDSIDWPTTCCIWDDRWLVECDEAVVARAAFTVDELERLFEGGLTGRLESDSFPVSHDEGANCSPRTNVVCPGRIEADDTSGAHAPPDSCIYRHSTELSLGLSR